MFSEGKIDAQILRRLLQTYSGTQDNRVKVGPGVGQDAAVVDLGDSYLVAKTDPITFVAEDMGWYCVNINANDVACMGADPAWFLCTMLLPLNTFDEAGVESLFQSVHNAAGQIGVAVCGGHTEVTHGIDRPLFTGQMLGQAAKDALVFPGEAQAGDSVLLTGGLAVEATGVIAAEKREELLQRGYSEDLLDTAQNFIYEPGISVLPAARITRDFSGVHALHDPTEGGVAAGLWELAEAAGLGMEIFKDRLFYHALTGQLCEEFDIAPFGAISSGALLVAVDGDQSKELQQAFAKEDIRVAEIGRIRERHFGTQVNENGSFAPLSWSSEDEITKLF